MLDTAGHAMQTVPAIYGDIGVRPIINGRGATTAVGGTLMSPEVLAAMTDAARIKALPESDGLANELVIHRAHRINYDQMLRVGGGRLVEIGGGDHTERRELEEAFTARGGGDF